MNISLTKIISGGQTGADLAGLMAAEKLGYQTGGTAAPQFMTSEGTKMKLLSGLGLQPLEWKGTWSASYVARSKKNVQNSDATLVFRFKASPGTDKTIGYALRGVWETVGVGNEDVIEMCGRKPVLICQKLTIHTGEEIRKFLIRHEVKTLNIAGNRGCQEMPTWQNDVERFLLESLPVYQKM